MAAKSNWSSVVKTIFVNLLFLIGVILIVIGFIGGTSTVVKLAVFDKYPLESYEETRCEIAARPVMPEEAMPKDMQTSEKCLERLEDDRKLKLVEDVTNAVSFSVAGIFLAMMFKGFIFEKKK